MYIHLQFFLKLLTNFFLILHRYIFFNMWDHKCMYLNNFSRNINCNRQDYKMNFSPEITELMGHVDGYY